MNNKKQSKFGMEDITQQSHQVLDVIEGGGVAVIPLDVAYAIIGNSRQSGMFSNYDLLKEIQIIEPWKHNFIKAVINDNDLPMSTVAPFHSDHPMFKNVDSWVLSNSTKSGTIDMLLNAGVLHNEVTRLSLEREMPVLGSSANTSLTGSKYTLEDIDEPVLEAADILIDGGKSKYANDEGRSSTIIDFENFNTIRVGVCYDSLCEIFLKFDIDLQEIAKSS